MSKSRKAPTISRCQCFHLVSKLREDSIWAYPFGRSKESTRCFRRTLNVAPWQYCVDKACVERHSSGLVSSSVFCRLRAKYSHEHNSVYGILTPIIIQATSALLRPLEACAQRCSTQFALRLLFPSGLASRISRAAQILFLSRTVGRSWLRRGSHDYHLSQPRNSTNFSS